MKFLKILVFPIIVAILAAILQVTDQLLSPHLLPSGNHGFTWIAFQTWALYFIAGCNVKGGIKTIIAVVVGIIASIIIMNGAGWFGLLGFFAIPASLFVFVIPVICLEKVPWMDFIPGIFIGAGAFFVFMTYIPYATFGSAALTEIIYLFLGLFWGWMSITFRGMYEKAIAKYNLK